jgi:hypothetical protein
MALVVPSACSHDSPTAAATPEIRATLQDVDSALVEKNYPDARQALKELKRLVMEAGAAGTLSDEQSGAIIAAANRLMQDLGAVEPGEPTPDVSSSPSVVEPEDEGDTQPDEKADKGKAKGKPDKPEKSDQSDDSPGNSENAPGHEDD